MTTIKWLLLQSKFWTALFLFVQVVLFYTIPAFPKELLTAADAFVGIVLGLLVGKQVYDDRKAKS